MILKRFNGNGESNKGAGMEIVKTTGLSKMYGKGDTAVNALSNVDLSIGEGEIVAIVGTSGSGKSTLLNMIGGLDVPSSGEVIVGGKSLSNMKNDELTIFRRRNIGFVFQDYSLMPLLSVKDNITLTLKLDGISEDERYLENLASMLKIDRFMERLPGELSGGEQQRVAIARALATKPAIVLADEPTGNLDSKTGSEVIGLINLSSKKYNQTVLIVTHDEEVAQIADRIIHIEDGMIVNR